MLGRHIVEENVGQLLRTISIKFGYGMIKWVKFEKVAKIVKKFNWK